MAVVTRRRFKGDQRRQIQSVIRGGQDILKLNTALVARGKPAILTADDISRINSRIVFYQGLLIAVDVV